jgi:hypothetical protein
MQPNSKTKIGWVAGIVAVWLAGLATVQAADFTSWAKKMPIQFTGYTRTETLTNFPALVTFTNGMVSGFSYADFLSTNADLRFTDATQTNELNYEIEKWATNGSSFVWVQVPLLANNVMIYAFWGKSGMSAPACTANGATWPTNYQGVWHMNAASARDSTENARHGSVSGGVSLVTGKVGDADSFNGVAGTMIDFPAQDLFRSSDDVSVEAWVSAQDQVMANAVILDYGHGVSPNPNMVLQRYNAAVRDFGWAVNNSANNSDWGPWSTPRLITFPSNQWTHLALTKQGTLFTCYLNGTLSWSGTYFPTIDKAVRKFRFGAYVDDNTTRVFLGSLDEIRVSNAARSSNWFMPAT